VKICLRHVCLINEKQTIFNMLLDLISKIIGRSISQNLNTIK
jgi:hypothetical protein